MIQTWLVCGHEGDVPAGADPEMLMCDRCQAKPFVPWHVEHMLEMPHSLRTAEPYDRDRAAIAASRSASVLWRTMVRDKINAERSQLTEYVQKCQAAGFSGPDLAKLVDKKIESQCLDPNITDPIRFVLGLEFVAPYLPDDKQPGTQVISPEYETATDENEESWSDRDPIAAERSLALEAYERECSDRGIKIGNTDVPKESRNAKKPVRRNLKYEAIDSVLCDISAARPKDHQEVFQLLESRNVAIPNRQVFKAAGGWLKGFQQNPHAASVWLSHVWARLGLSAFARGPKK